MEAPPQGYRRNVGICLINNSKTCFAASRLDVPNAWQMPQVRESLLSVLNHKSRILLKFTGKDEEINLLGDGTEKAEFGEWSWMSADQIVDLLGG